MTPASTAAGARYDALDGLRGVAALAVVIYHLRAVGLAPDIAPHAQLAVDFFFVLSGFVVANAYVDRLAGAMPPRLFAARRLIRLLPLAFLGALIGLVGVIVRWRLAPGHADPLDRILISGALNLVMLPSFVSGPAYGYAIFPGDGPLWSLFFELAVNLLWGWFGARLTTRQLGCIVVLMGVWLTTLAVAHGSTRMGVAWTTFWGGGARAGFGFGLGVLLYRLKDRLPTVRWSGAPLLAAGVIIVVFVAPLWLARGEQAGLVWDLGAILLVLPATVALAAGHAQAKGVWRRLGELSYPLYVLHYPCLAAAAGLRQRVFPQSDAAVVAALAMLAVILLSWAMLKLYDEPVRRRLTGRLAPPPAPRG